MLVISPPPFSSSLPLVLLSPPLLPVGAAAGYTGLPVAALQEQQNTAGSTGEELGPDGSAEHYRQ